MKMLHTVIIFITKYQVKLLFLLFVFFFLTFISTLPYINLVLDIYFSLFIMLLLSIILLKLESHHAFLYALFFYFISMVFLLLGLKNYAEGFGNIVFGNLVVGIIMLFTNNYKKI